MQYGPEGRPSVKTAYADGLHKTEWKQIDEHILHLQHPENPKQITFRAPLNKEQVTFRAPWKIADNIESW